MLISLGASTNIKDRKGRTPGDFKTYFDTKVLLKIGNTTFFHPSICFHLSLLPSSHLAHCGAEKGQLETVQVLTEHKSIKKNWDDTKRKITLICPTKSCSLRREELYGTKTGRGICLCMKWESFETLVLSSLSITVMIIESYSWSRCPGSTIWQEGSGEVASQSEGGRARRPEQGEAGCRGRVKDWQEDEKW